MKMTTPEGQVVEIGPSDPDPFVPDHILHLRDFPDAWTIVQDGKVVTEGILPELGTITPPKNIYMTGRGRRQRVVSEFQGNPIPLDAVNHIGNLCLCLHDRRSHYSALGKAGTHEGMRGYVSEDDQTTDACASQKADGYPCSCRRFNPVAPRASKHAFSRSRDKIVRRKVADLIPGDRVLAGWSGSTGKVRLTDQTKGYPMVVTLTGRKRTQKGNDRDLSWASRMWTFTTDIGQAVPIAGGDTVGVVSSS